jgi:hypothetical protein
MTKRQFALRFGPRLRERHFGLIMFFASVVSNETLDLADRLKAARALKAWGITPDDLTLLSVPDAVEPKKGRTK